MATRKPLSVVNGALTAIAAGDTVDPVTLPSLDQVPAAVAAVDVGGQQVVDAAAAVNPTDLPILGQAQGLASTAAGNVRLNGLPDVVPATIAGQVPSFDGTRYVPVTVNTPALAFQVDDQGNTWQRGMDRWGREYWTQLTAPFPYSITIGMSRYPKRYLAPVGGQSALDDATVFGSIYVWPVFGGIHDSASMPAITQVNWWIDPANPVDPAGASITPTFTRTVAPYDLQNAAANGEANPWDLTAQYPTGTSLGTVDQAYHTVVCQVVFAVGPARYCTPLNGRTYARFYVSNKPIASLVVNGVTYSESGSGGSKQSALGAFLAASVTNVGIGGGPAVIPRGRYSQGVVIAGSARSALLTCTTDGGEVVMDSASPQVVPSTGATTGNQVTLGTNATQANLTLSGRFHFIGCVNPQADNFTMLGGEIENPGHTVNMKGAKVNGATLGVQMATPRLIGTCLHDCFDHFLYLQDFSSGQITGISSARLADLLSGAHFDAIQSQGDIAGLEVSGTYEGNLFFTDRAAGSNGVPGFSTTGLIVHDAVQQKTPRNGFDISLHEMNVAPTVATVIGGSTVTFPTANLPTAGQAMTFTAPTERVVVQSVNTGTGVVTIVGTFAKVHPTTKKASWSLNTITGLIGANVVGGRNLQDGFLPSTGLGSQTALDAGILLTGALPADSGLAAPAAAQTAEPLRIFVANGDATVALVNPFTATISALSNVSTLVTATVASTALMAVGQYIGIAGPANLGFSSNPPTGNFVVNTIIDSTHFTFISSPAPTGTYTPNSATLTYGPQNGAQQSGGTVPYQSWGLAGTGTAVTWASVVGGGFASSGPSPTYMQVVVAVPHGTTVTAPSGWSEYLIGGNPLADDASGLTLHLYSKTATSGGDFTAITFTLGSSVAYAAQLLGYRFANPVNPLASAAGWAGLGDGSGNAVAPNIAANLIAAHSLVVRVFAVANVAGTWPNNQNPFPGLNGLPYERVRTNMPGTATSLAMFCIDPIFNDFRTTDPYGGPLPTGTQAVAFSVASQRMAAATIVINPAGSVT